MCVKSVHIQGCRKVDFQMAETGNLQGKTGAFSASFDQKVPDLHKGFTRLEWSGKGFTRLEWSGKGFTRLDWWVREMVHQAGLMGPGNGSPAWLHGHGYTGMAVPVMATRAWLYPSWLYPSWLYRSPIMAVPLTHHGCTAHPPIMAVPLTPSWLYRSPRHGCTGHWTGCTGHWLYRALDWLYRALDWDWDWDWGRGMGTGAVGSLIYASHRSVGGTQCTQWHGEVSAASSPAGSADRKCLTRLLCLLWQMDHCIWHPGGSKSGKITDFLTFWDPKECRGT